ncbi:MAG: translation initiation factor IF-3 [Acidimicrobiaceae bacterium]|nr:translation initiation factor IF-3 [Acidimicrobiaceae bacterium]
MATPTNQEPRINDRIRARQVRLVSPDGEQMGIQTLSDALDAAQEIGLDLVEVADKADPPVCRIMDYGKFKYEQSQRAKESRKKATHVLVKEMKYRPKIGPGDFETKTRKVEAFLSDGCKVKVTIMFRGREMQHPELGRRILDRVAEVVSHVGRVELYPKQDGRNMIMVLVPGQATRKQREAAADRQVVDTEPDSGEAAEAAALEATETAETVAPATDTTAPEATQPETPSEAAVAEDQPTEPTSA